MTKWVPLEKVAKYTTKRITTKEITIDQYITTDCLLQNKAGITRATNLPPKSIKLSKYDKGHILISNIRPYLKKIWYANKSGGCSADVLNLEIFENYNPSFVYYSILSDDFFAHMMKGSKGSKMPRGDKDQILTYRIPDFEINYQKKVETILSTIDSKISLNNKISVELEALAKTIYEYWFIQFDFPNENKKAYKSDGGEMVFNDELKRWIPEGWEVGSLLDIASFTNGLACQKYRPINNDKLRVIKIKEMHEGFSNDTEFVRADIPEKVKVINGDILFSWSASLEVMLWTKGIGALNQHIFKVSSKNYPRSYYYFQLKDYLYHFQMMAENRKTTMGHITQEHLIQSKVILPPIEIVQELENKIAPLFNEIINVQEQNQKLMSLREWVTPLIMNEQISIES